MAEQTKLYYISHTDENGDDMSLFVSAYNVYQAVGIWWRYYGYDDDYFDEEPSEGRKLQIVEVPSPSPQPGACPWNEISVNDETQYSLRDVKKSVAYYEMLGRDS